MKTKLSLSMTVNSAFACLVAVVLLAAAPITSAQTSWGNEISFDGADDYVIAGAVNLSNVSFTVELWAKRAATGVYHQLASQGTDSSENNCWQLVFTSTDTVGFTFWGPGVYTTPFTSTGWHHWAATYNVTNDVVCIYRDGILAASTTNSAIDYQQTGPLYIGRYFDGATPRHFSGILDDVRVWNVARTGEAIQADLSHPLTGAEPNLMAYWPFDEGAGTNVFDATSNGYDGTLFGGAQWTISTVPQVTSLADSGPGTLRQAVAAASTNLGPSLFPRPCPVKPSR